MIILNFGRRNRLTWSRIVADDDHRRTVARWLNGRLFGCFVSLSVPSRW